MHTRVKKGFDLPLEGTPDPVIEPAREVSSVALLGSDYVGLEPRMQAEDGDVVRAGQSLFVDKGDPEVRFTAPGSGRITAINRGARRILKSVVIQLTNDESEEVRWPVRDPDKISRDDLRSVLLQSGLWTAFRTRPFSRVPDSRSEPRSIFVTAMATQPLAGDPTPVIEAHSEAFALGLDLLPLLTSGSVYLCTGSDWRGPLGSAPTITHATFEGAHPAGLAGTHIHHLDPVGADRVVWHVGYQDVIAIGKLIGEGCFWTERVVALGGNGIAKPRMVRARLGANIAELTAGELAPTGPGDDQHRLISGCVLNGRHAFGSESFLGRYHLQVAAINQKLPHRTLRWRRLFDRRFTFARTFTRPTGQPAPTHFTTDQNGRATALVPIDAFERLIPLDMLAEPLLRALLIKDTEQAQALGCLELDEEDLALCSFVCPGKNDYGAVLRANLQQIEQDG